MAKRHWTEEEEDFLQDHVGDVTFTHIAKKLNRSYDSVRVKASKMGLGNPREVAGLYSAHHMAQLLDVDMCVLYRWMRDYDFPAMKKNLSRQRTSQHKQYNYNIDPVEFWEWAYNHKDLLNFAKIEYDSILPEPKWVNQERSKDYHSIPKRKHQIWTEQEDKQLLQFNRLGWKYEDMGQRLNRSAKACIKRLEWLRTHTDVEVKQRHVQKNWTDEEIKKLLELREQKLSWPKIGEAMLRSAGSVRDKWERVTKKDLQILT